MASEWANGGSPAESEDPGGPEAELRELEDELCRLGGVLSYNGMVQIHESINGQGKRRHGTNLRRNFGCSARAIS